MLISTGPTTYPLQHWSHSPGTSFSYSPLDKQKSHDIEPSFRTRKPHQNIGHTNLSGQSTTFSTYQFLVSTISLSNLFPNPIAISLLAIVSSYRLVSFENYSIASGLLLFLVHCSLLFTTRSLHVLFSVSEGLSQTLLSFTIWGAPTLVWMSLHKLSQYAGVQQLQVITHNG